MPESVCTRCNAKLIPEFQARGDWCKEHGLPETQCTICHPDLIEKFRKMAPASASPPVADWCAGHGVPESVCTRCNAKLIPEFQARGDWCKEHGLPESQCTICHPDLIEKFRKMAPKPPKAEGKQEIGDPKPYEGVKVRLATPGTAAKAGILTELVRSGTAEPAVEAPARLVFDGMRTARVSSPAAGVIREMHVVAGTRLRAGQSVLALASPEASQAMVRLRDADAALALARQTLDREKHLVSLRASAQKDLLEAERQYRAAEAALAGARGVAGSLGMSADAVDGASELLVLRAPQAAVVTRVDVTVGQVVTPSQLLIELNDPEHLWAELDLMERDASRVSVGSKISLVFDSFADRPFIGTIVWLSPEVTALTRTVRSRAEVANPEGLLRAGMFGRARVALSAHANVVLPGDAVQDTPEGPVAFVEIEPQVYEPRPLRLGKMTKGSVEVLAGLSRGERVVTQGSFLLKTEIMKGSLGAGCCDLVEQ